MSSDKRFCIPVKWQVESTVLVEASSLEEAINKVKNNFDFYVPDNYKHDFESVRVTNIDYCYEYVD